MSEDDWDTNPWVSVTELLGSKKTVAVIAHAVETLGIQTWDPYGRRVIVKPGTPDAFHSAEKLLDVLARYYDLISDPTPRTHEEKLEILDFLDGEPGNPLNEYGWRQDDLPDFRQLPEKDGVLSFQGGSIKPSSAATPTRDSTYLNIIGAMLDLMLEASSPGRQRYSSFASQTALIEQILAHHEGKTGLSKRTLEDKFAAAKRSLGES